MGSLSRTSDRTGLKNLASTVQETAIALQRLRVKMAQTFFTFDAFSHHAPPLGDTREPDQKMRYFLRIWVVVFSSTLVMKPTVSLIPFIAAVAVGNVLPTRWRPLRDWGPKNSKRFCVISVAAKASNTLRSMR